MSSPIIASLHNMRAYYESGTTRTLAFRREQLNTLSAALAKYESQLHEALRADIGKTPEESWITETGFLQYEIRFLKKHLRQWMLPEKVSTNLLNFPSKSYIIREPKGVVLIVGPWNYPLLLLFAPLAGAIAAGNCMMLKASELSKSTSSVMQALIAEYFDPAYISYSMEDGSQVVPEMMNGFRFDHVFYTGSPGVGKSVYKMAAEKLVSVTLELGGKSPAVVEADANLSVAAKRILVTKFSNTGQMCVAPDYVLVHEDVKEKFTGLLLKYVRDFYGADPSASYDFGHIISEKHFDRLLPMLGEGKLLYGAQHNREKRFISPTIIDAGSAAELNEELRIMNEEIFGPILPLVSFKSFDEAKKLIARNPEPLSFYVFTSSKKNEERWLDEIPFGGGCVNNASWQFTNSKLPFGGRGNSGTGNYHGWYSFNTFSHMKSVLKTPTWFDPSIKYPSFKGKLGLFKKLHR